MNFIKIPVAIALAFAAITAAADAHADSFGDNFYLQTLQHEYYYHQHSDAEWLREGHKVCDAHLRGATDDQLQDLVKSDFSFPDSRRRSRSSSWPRSGWHAESHSRIVGGE